jgi:tRNA-specific 2-thiouridylase
MATPKAMIAMSGGVDSSVAAWLSQKQGFECLGVTLKLIANPLAETDQGRTCCSLRDTEDARQVAGKLEIPFYVLNFTSLFEELVIDRFVRTYAQGATPNPCIDCNRYIKFEQLLRRAQALGRDYLVTGHYARIERAPSGRYLLKKGLDPAKDQSYVLYTLTQEQLAHVLFPLGNLHKSQVRAIAARQGFSNAGKRVSQDICFVPDGHYGQFIERRQERAAQKGYFVDRGGKILGRHRGIIHYTIGQRRGLNLALGKPVYVCAINHRDNTVVVDEASALYSRTLAAENINLIAQDEIRQPLPVKARLRYRQEEQPALVRQTEADRLEIQFQQPQRAVTKGQAVVLYDGDTVLGGGTIV